MSIDRNQPGRVADRQGPETEAVDDAEDRGVGGDAEGKRRNRHGRQGRVAPDGADCVRQVLPEPCMLHLSPGAYLDTDRRRTAPAAVPSACRFCAPTGAPAQANEPAGRSVKPSSATRPRERVGRCSRRSCSTCAGSAGRAAAAGVHRGGGWHAGARHRGDHGDVRARPRHAAEAAAVRGSGAPRARAPHGGGERAPCGRRRPTTTTTASRPAASSRWRAAAAGPEGHRHWRGTARARVGRRGLARPVPRRSASRRWRAAGSPRRRQGRRAVRGHGERAPGPGAVSATRAAPWGAHSSGIGPRRRHRGRRSSA